MRSTMLLAVMVALPALAGTKVDCTLEHDPDDVVVKQKDLVVEAPAKNVLAIEGNVTLKKGAVVKSVLVSGGTLTLEPGAVVEESVVVLGTLKVDPKATIKGSRIVIGDSIRIVGEDGDDVNFDLNINGTSLGRQIVDAAVKEMKGCKVVDTPPAKKTPKSKS